MPPSSTKHFRSSPPAWTGFFGLCAFATLVYFWPMALARPEISAFVIFLTALFICLLVADIFGGALNQVAFSERIFRRFSGEDIARLAHKTVAMAALAVGIIGIYRFAPLYQDQWYQRFLGPAIDAAPIIFASMILYVIVVDRLLRDPDDGLADFGRFVTFRSTVKGRGRLRNFLAGMLVKVFFLPLMFGYGLDDWVHFQINVFTIESFRDFFEICYRMLFFIDVVFAIIGYATASRLIGTQVVLSEPTFRGWVVCIVCYAPFWQVIGRNFLDYSDNIVWGTVFAENGLMYTIWGSLILLVLAGYVSATAIFGLRFSNLTYRGTVHRGPYAYLRHPAYTLKLVSYAMIELPFIGPSAGETLFNLSAFTGLGIIYYLRARHEENCCAQAREYRIYLSYMRRHGLLERAVRRIHSAFRRKSLDIDALSRPQ